jgi:hypothetical protein
MDILFNDNWKEQYSQALIRPMRAYSYEEQDLGPRTQMINNHRVERLDFTIMNQKQQ